MKRNLTLLATLSSLALLSSCDTTALEQVLNQPSSYDSGYGRPPAQYHQDGYNRPYYNQDGYNQPYRPQNDAHRGNQAQMNREAYQSGYRLGAEDFRKGREKKYMRHSDMYDASTREKFKDGFYDGYDKARDDYNRRNKKRR